MVSEKCGTSVVTFLDPQRGRDQAGGDEVGSSTAMRMGGFAARPGRIGGGSLAVTTSGAAGSLAVTTSGGAGG